MQIHQSAEDYLETILMLSQRMGKVRSIDVVNELGFTKASVSIAMKKLRENGYIAVDGEGNLTLLAPGREIAERIYSRHRLLTHFFMQLGVDEKTAAEDACKAEHILSEQTLEKIRERARATGDTGEDVLELLDMIERGFDDIEHRISNMDKEHSKYVRATVTRLNYLLSGESDTKGLVIQLLNRMSEDDYEEVIQKTGEKMNLSLVEILSEKSLYKRRKNRKDFVSQMAQEEEVDDLDREDVLRLNRIKRRFSKKQIEEFIEEHIEKDVLDTEKLSLTSEEDFEKLILAYDLSTRKNSKYKTLEEDAETIEKNGYRYPALKFVRRHL